MGYYYIFFSFRRRDSHVYGRFVTHIVCIFSWTEKKIIMFMLVAPLRIRFHRFHTLHTYIFRICEWPGACVNVLN